MTDSLQWMTTLYGQLINWAAIIQEARFTEYAESNIGDTAFKNQAGKR